MRFSARAILGTGGFGDAVCEGGDEEVAEEGEGKGDELHGDVGEGKELEEAEAGGAEEGGGEGC